MTWHNVSGAGGLYSSVHDMSRWVNMQLAGGTFTDAKGTQQRLFSEERQQEMWSVITPITIPKPLVPELEAARPNFLGYGEGWQLSDYRGRKVVSHTGGWPGMVSRVTMVPQQKLGVIVLTNAEVGGAFNAVTMRVLDAFGDAPRTDWTAAYAAALAKSKDKADEDWRKHVQAREADAPPSRRLSAYARTYRDPWYGDIVVEQDKDGLVMRFTRTPDLVGRMEPWQHDTFIVRWNQRWLNADAFVTFVLDADGEVREARMEAISPLTDFSFDFQDLRLTPVEEKKKSES